MPTADDTNNPFLGLPHYVTGTYTRNSTFLDDVEYSRALDVFVKGCADIFLTDSQGNACLLYTSPSPRDGLLSRMPSSA